MMFCLLYGIGSMGAKKSLEREIPEDETLSKRGQKRLEIHPLLWRPALLLTFTPYHAPRANAICEQFLRSVRQECLDHLLILQEKQLQRVLNSYVTYFNQARPHQGIQQQIPNFCGSSRSAPHEATKVVAVPILAGLHHDYRKVA